MPLRKGGPLLATWRQTLLGHSAGRRCEPGLAEEVLIPLNKVGVKLRITIEIDAVSYAL